LQTVRSAVSATSGLLVRTVPLYGIRHIRITLNATGGIAPVD